MADLKKQGEIDALEAQKKQAEKKKDSDNEGFETQINGLETEKETREKFYEDVVARLDKIINPDKQTESNPDAYGETSTPVNSAKSAETNSTNTNVQNANTQVQDTKKPDYASQGKTFSAASINDYYKSIGYDVPNTKEMTRLLPNLGQASINNALSNVQNPIANASNVVNNSGANSTSIVVNIPSGITITNPVGDSTVLAKTILTTIDSAMTQEYAKRKK